MPMLARSIIEGQGTIRRADPLAGSPSIAELGQELVDLVMEESRGGIQGPRGSVEPDGLLDRPEVLFRGFGVVLAMLGPVAGAAPRLFLLARAQVPT